MSNFHDVYSAKFDVVIASGPRTWPWPSVGAWTLSTLCSEMGLKVGMYGGDATAVKGILPLPGTGAILLAEDARKRIHRIHARSLVRLSATLDFPDYFPGWDSQGVIPYSTAKFLLKEGFPLWDPCTVILGSGNRALRLGSQLLSSGTTEVYCVESSAQWEGKRYAGWEVERRRFEILGGKLIEGTPLSLSQQKPLLWELRIQDVQGVRILPVSRVISVGPFSSLSGDAAAREYPQGSLLFELEQSALLTEEEDVDGWRIEAERARSIALKIARALVSEWTSEQKNQFDRLVHRTRVRLKKFYKHRKEPFGPGFKGKWLEKDDLERIQKFEGVPKEQFKKRLVASVECFESISCTLCHEVCPTHAIDEKRALKEDACTACGLCLQKCPTGAIVMIREQTELSNSSLVFAWKNSRKWNVGEFTQLLNRRGEVLGNGRIIELLTAPEVKTSQLVRVEVPTHLMWEARGLKRARSPGAAEDQSFLSSEAREKNSGQKVEILVDGEKRLAIDGLSVSSALFEMGHARAGDVLHCSDGSCGLCTIVVDGSKRLGCKTVIHKGMSMELREKGMSSHSEKEKLCLCLGIDSKTVVDRVRQGHLTSAEAVLSSTPVGSGKCHGGRCMEKFRRILASEGMDMANWIDWRFPWSDWKMSGS